MCIFGVDSLLKLVKKTIGGAQLNTRYISYLTCGEYISFVLCRQNRNRFCDGPQ